MENVSLVHLELISTKNQTYASNVELEQSTIMISKHVFYLPLKNQLQNAITKKYTMKIVEIVYVQPTFLMTLDTDALNAITHLTGVKTINNVYSVLMEQCTTTSNTNV